MGLPQFGKQGAIVLLCVINFVNYIDRGIIPGAPQQFQSFITETLHVSVTQQSVYLGLLASAFIASYSVFSILFGYLALTWRPFRMMGLGMSFWVLAVVCCGLAHAFQSYNFLLFGRVLSGIGEASFQCNATPFINRHASEKNRTLWMGVFLASITAGTAFGYIYGSSIAATSLSWGGAFFIEGVLMIGLIFCCLHCIPEELDCIPSDEEEVAVKLGTPNSLADELLVHQSVHRRSEISKSSRPSFYAEEDEPTTPAIHHADASSVSFFSAWLQVLKDIGFVLVVVGHAAYTFSVAALSVFVPVILIGLGLFETEMQVSLVFGGLIVVTGMLGTPAGGILVDRWTRGASCEKRLYVSVKMLFVLMAASWVCAASMLAFTHSKMVFMSVLGVCFFLLCMTTPCETVAVLELFPESRRAMAVAANTLIIHVLGDVPSPIILGWLKDSWAPRCGTVDLDGEAKLNPDCHLDHDGLRKVLMFPVLWLLWGVVFWALSVFYVRRRLIRKAFTQITPGSA